MKLRHFHIIEIHLIINIFRSLRVPGRFIRTLAFHQKEKCIHQIGSLENHLLLFVYHASLFCSALYLTVLKAEMSCFSSALLGGNLYDSCQLLYHSD